ncbi:MAG: hypothetical protein AMXMBFR58_36240 [Phycisphaerae bacterium]
MAFGNAAAIVTGTPLSAACSEIEFVLVICAATDEHAINRHVSVTTAYFRCIGISPMCPFNFAPHEEKERGPRHEWDIQLAKCRIRASRDQPPARAPQLKPTVSLDKLVQPLGAGTRVVRGSVWTGRGRRAAAKRR